MTTKMKWEIDPTGAFLGVDAKRLIDACGLIPGFLSPDDPRDAIEQFKANYGFGVYPMRGMTLQADGTASYPGDPPMKPIVRGKLRQETILIFQHGYVCVHGNGKVFFTRMD